MEAEVETVRVRNVLVMEWVLTVLWCLYILWKNNLSLGYQLGFCALAAAVLLYAVKARAWRFLTLASAVAFLGSLWGVLLD